jgi:hypothetical protein
MSTPVMRAKMRVAAVNKNADNSEGLQLSAVCKSGAYNEDGSGDENNTFARFTPLRRPSNGYHQS